MSNYGGSQTYQDISGVCLQRSRRQLLVPPNQRLELQKSPYPNYTQFQLDMRRKAQILAYADPTVSSSSKKNYAGIVQRKSGYTQQQLQQFIDGTPPCNNTSVRTPTSSCDIPGPIFDIFLDPNVPLYRYLPDQLAGSVIPNTQTRKYLTYITNDIPIDTFIKNNIFVIYIDNYIPNPISSFTFSLPFIIYASNPIITNLFVYSYYNSTLLSTNDSNGYYTNGSTPYLSYPPIVSSVLTHIDPTHTLCQLNVSSFHIPTNPGDIIDISVVITFTNPGITVIGNPIGGSGLVISLDS